MTDEAIDPFAEFLTNPPKDVAEMRAMIAPMMEAGNADLPEIGASHDDVLIRTTDGHDLTVDIHVPKGQGPFPVLVYLHGGGWVLGSPKTHRRLGFRFAEAGFLVFNVDYRLGPENPFPGAFYDSVDAIRWVAAHAAEYGGDASRLAVGGDSAGGNLTAAAAAALADDDGVDIKAILLIYAALDFAGMAHEGPAGLMATAYIGHDRDNLVKDWRVSPIHAAEKLPPALVLCGSADELMADAEALAGRLDAAGKEFETAYYESMPHGFVQMEELFEQAPASIARMVEFLNARL